MEKLFEATPFPNEKGYGFTFKANDHVSYYVLFNRIQNIFQQQKNSALLHAAECFLMEFNHTEGYVAPETSKAGYTICMVLQQFMIDKPKAVIFGVYDDTKVSDRVRHRLLQMWFNRYNTQSLYKKVDILSGADKKQIVTFFYKADNEDFKQFLS